MGGGFLIPPPSMDGRDENVSPVKYREVFDEQFPYYLSIGMTYEQFYYEDCRLVIAYRKAQKMREQRRNQELWLQGMYFYDALCSASPLLHAFAKSGTKPLPYSEQPYPLTQEEVEEREREKERKQYEINKGRFTALINSINEDKNKADK